MYTIGQLVHSFGLSRSTLLYYDKIGLLQPSARSEAGYRLYTQKEHDRLAQILIYKESGLSLAQVAEVLDGAENTTARILEHRLESLNQEISGLRKKQRLILHMLGQETLFRSAKVMNKEQWVGILSACGMSEEDMRQWHIEFERALPEVHSDFLESLGIEKEERTKIKSWSSGKTT